MTYSLIDIALILVSLSTIGLILLNQPATGDTFGSKDTLSTTRRGFEKQIHNLTVLSSVALIVLVLASQLVR